MKKSMSERERVIARLNVQIQNAHRENSDFAYIPVGTAKLIIELLEKQAVKPDWEGGGSMYWDVCGECHTAIARQDRFCRQCGKEIDWS